MKLKHRKSERDKGGNKNEPLINDEIRGYDVVRVIYKVDGMEKEQSEVVSLYDARKKARDMQLDLVLINEKAVPPIVKVCDYSKFMYERKKQMKQNQKVTSQVKEVQLTTNIGKHDLEIKANKAKEFINEGHKVKVVLTMRGRELGRREESKRCLYEYIMLLEDVAVPESMPKDDSNKSIVILKKKK